MVTLEYTRTNAIELDRNCFYKIHEINGFLFKVS